MVEFNRKKTYRKYLYSPLTLLALFILFLIFLKALWGVYTKERLSARYLQREQGELNRILDRKKELAQSIDFLKTDHGVEAEIRSKFRVVKDGESVAIIVDNDKTPSTTEATTTPTLWQRVTGFFGF